MMMAADCAADAMQVAVPTHRPAHAAGMMMAASVVMMMMTPRVRVSLRVCRRGRKAVDGQGRAAPMASFTIRMTLFPLFLRTRSAPGR